MYTCLRARKSNCVQGTESPYRSCQWWYPATDVAATTTTAAATTAATTAATAVATATTAAATTTAATTTAADIYLVIAVKVSA